MKLVILITALAFVACSSKSKTEATDAATEQVESSVQEATDAASNTVETESPKQKEKSTPVATSSDTSSSSFPEISGTEKSSATCSNNSDNRKITVLNVTEGGCGVVYNKMGEDKTVAVAKVDMSYCDTVASKIKTNLEGAGFSCGGEATSSEAASGNQ